MSRRTSRRFDARLDRAEATVVHDRWELTLDDGTTACLPHLGPVNAAVEALEIIRARDAGQIPPEPSAKLRTVARGDLAAVSSVNEGAAIQFARLACGLDDQNQEQAAHG